MPTWQVPSWHLRQIVQPIAFGATLGLNPLVVLIVTIAAGSLFGMVGLVLAAPLTSAATHIAADVAACLEFVLMPAVRSMLDEVAPLWDASGGRGGLGLCGAVRRGVERVELDSFCRVWAARTARARNWASAPEIIWLDSTG